MSAEPPGLSLRRFISSANPASAAAPAPVSAPPAARTIAAPLRAKSRASIPPRACRQESSSASIEAIRASSRAVSPRPRARRMGSMRSRTMGYPASACPRAPARPAARYRRAPAVAGASLSSADTSPRHMARTPSRISSPMGAADAGRARGLSCPVRARRAARAPACAARSPRQKIAPLWVFTPPVAANMLRSPSIPMGLSRGRRARGSDGR